MLSCLQNTPWWWIASLSEQLENPPHFRGFNSARINLRANFFHLDREIPMSQSQYWPHPCAGGGYRNVEVYKMWIWDDNLVNRWLWSQGIRWIWCDGGQMVGYCHQSENPQIPPPRPHLPPPCPPLNIFALNDRFKTLVVQYQRNYFNGISPNPRSLQALFLHHGWMLLTLFLHGSHIANWYWSDQRYIADGGSLYIWSRLELGSVPF